MQSIEDIAVKNSILAKDLQEGKLKKSWERTIRCILFTAH